jgi:hypothetical protein
MRSDTQTVVKRIRGLDDLSAVVDDMNAIIVLDHPRAMGVSP